MQINHNNSCALNNIYIFYGFYDIDSYGVLCDDGIRLRQQPESEKKVSWRENNQEFNILP